MRRGTKLIPRVSSAILTLGATACGGGGGGGGLFDGGVTDGGPDGGVNPRVTSLADGLCRAWQECEPDEFNYEFETFGECVADYEGVFGRYAELYAEAYGQACGEAFLDYYACVIDDLDDCSYGEGACYGALDSFYDVCGI